MSKVLMYLGPSLARPVHLPHKSVFSGGIPGFAKSLTDKNPDLAACFVPVAEAGAILRELEGYPGAKAGAATSHYLAVKRAFVDKAPAVEAGVIPSGRAKPAVDAAKPNKEKK